ncbi:MAG: acyl-CoA dehydrogenase family protein [Alphaproteobacteria bacterium]
MFDIPEEVRLLRETVRRFVRKHYTEHEALGEAVEQLPDELHRALRKKSVEAGLYGYNMPRRLGGPGLTALAVVALQEELGYTTMPLAETLGHLPGSLVEANDEQLEWFIKPIMNADKIVSYALTEPDAGSDLGNLKTRARLDGDEWVLNGSKQFISGAAISDYIIVLAVSEPGASLTKKFTTFIVERNNPGLKMGRTFKKMGWRGHPLSAFSLEDCRVPRSHVLGPVGSGFRAIMATINHDRVAMASRCVGMASAMLEHGKTWIKQRRAFGQVLANFQSIQFKVADADVAIEAARLLVLRAAQLADEGNPEFRIAACRAKLFASEMFCRVSDDIFQFFGGAGFMCELPIERFYRDARGFRIGEGTSEMQRIQIARHALA